MEIREINKKTAFDFFKQVFLALLLKIEILFHNKILLVAPKHLFFKLP